MNELRKRTALIAGISLVIATIAILLDWSIPAALCGMIFGMSVLVTTITFSSIGAKVAEMISGDNGYVQPQPSFDATSELYPGADPFGPNSAQQHPYL